MDRTTIAIDPTTTKLRRVGRLSRHRMRIDGAALADGRHTDGTVTIEISGLGPVVAGRPAAFRWEADRPIALVIVRSGVDGEAVSFDVGPSRRGIARAAATAGDAGIRYIAFCYDAPATGGRAEASPASQAAHAPIEGELPVPAADPTPAASTAAAPIRGVVAAARALAPTGRERRSILGMILGRHAIGRATS